MSKAIGLSVAACLWFGSSGRVICQPFNWTTIVGLPGADYFEAADGTNSDARFLSPRGIALDDAGNIYVADAQSSSIRKVSHQGTNWVVYTLAGRGPTVMDGTNVLYSGSADGTNSDARFMFPTAVALDSRGNIYVADMGNNTIRKITPMGTNYAVTTIAGLAGTFGTADGTNSNARFHGPWGITVDGAGNMSVTEYYNHTIRRIEPAGTNWVVSTVAGTPETPGAANGMNTAARFQYPTGIAGDKRGNLYVADRGNGTIRKLAHYGADWVVSTLAGSPMVFGSADGTNGAARFAPTEGIAVDNEGNLYVSDSGNSTVRMIRPVGADWVVSTVAGVPGVSGHADGTTTNALLDCPTGVAVDNAGALYAADEGYRVILSGQQLPALQSQLIEGRLTFCWPVTAMNFVLEACTNFGPDAIWNAVTTSPSVSGGSCILTNNPTGQAAYYRLRKL